MSVVPRALHPHTHTGATEIKWNSIYFTFILNWMNKINEEDEKEMFGRQKEILNAYGLTRD